MSTRSLFRGANTRGEIFTAAAVAAGVAVTVALGVKSSLLVLLPAAALVILGAAFLVSRIARSGSTDGGGSDKPLLPHQYRWVPAAWVVFCFVSNQKLSQRSVLAAASGKPSFESAVELAFYAAVAVLLFVQWLPRSATSRGRILVLLYAWPTWALLSTTWSLIPLYTFVRSLQLFVPISLAVFSARVLDHSDTDVMALARPVFRAYIEVTTLLALFAFALPYHYAAPVSPLLPPQPVDTRLAWYGIHPLEAATYWGVAVLVLIVGGRRLLGLSWPGWLGRLAVLAAAAALAQGRSQIIGFVVVLVLALWVGFRNRPLARYLGLLYYLAVIVGGIVVFHHQLFDAATRGEGTTRLFNLDGRIPLWQLTLSQIHSVKDLFLGGGLGASRVLLFNDVSWAGQTHNSFIEALIGTGVIGVLLLVAFLACIGWMLRTKKIQPLPASLHAAIVAVFGLMLVLNSVNAELAGTGFSFVIVCFVATFVLRARTPKPATLPGQPSESLLSDAPPLDLLWAP